jgi:transposase
MKENKIILGCDLSKDKTDIASIEKQNKNKVVSEKTYSNSIKGFRNIIKPYSSMTDKLHIVLEATGNYHIKFTDFLESKNIIFSIVNPLIIKRFAQMKMIRLKTDKVDAKVIAKYGIEQHPKPHKPITKAQKQLKSLTTVRNHLIKQRTMTKNLLHSQELLSDVDTDALKAIKSDLRTLNLQIKKLDNKIETLTKEHYNKTYTKILSIKGIGTKTASGSIAYLGDLSNFETHKQIASFIGITPSIRQSGKSLNKTAGITKQGNANLRTLFYLAALSASKYNRACKELYLRLLAKGKQKKTALIAVANKLIKQMFAIVKFNRTYISNYNILLDS